MPKATTVITRFVQDGLVWLCRTRRLFSLACLNGSFLICADQPDTLAQECLGRGIGLQNRTSSFQESGRIMNVLPSMIAPRTKPLGFEPTTYCTWGDRGKTLVLGYASSQFSSTPAREWDLFLFGQATG